MLFTPFYYLLEKNTRIKIEFDMLHDNLHDFSERQKWMSKIFVRLENKLEDGKIMVSHDKLIYNLNIKLMKSNNYAECLNNIEQWILHNQHDSEFYKSLKQILPEEDIKSIEKIAYKKKLLKIFEPEYISIIIWILNVVFIYLSGKPELIDKIIGKIP